MRRLAARLASPDAQQYLALYLIALLFALLASWPSPPREANDSWFTLAYTRAAFLGLLGLGYGVTSLRASRDELRTTALMLVCFAFVALPVELAAYAATYPPTPLSWLLALPPLTVLAMFGIGIGLGRLLDLARLRVLSPVAVPALLLGMVALDVAIGRNLLNPFTAAARVSLPHLFMLIMVAIVVLTALWLRPIRRAVQ